MAKRYRWIKIEEDFFRQKEVKGMRRLEGGDSYVIVYQKMMAHSLKNDNRIYFDNVEDSFVEEISLMIDEDVKKIEATLAFLEKVNLVEWASEDELVFNQVDELTGSESESAQRVRKHRAAKKSNSEIDKSNKTTGKNNDAPDKVTNKKADVAEKTTNKKNDVTDEIAQKKADVTEKTKCNERNVTKKNLCEKNVTLEKEKELELERELELETDTEKNKSVGGCVDENLKKITKTYEANIGPLYPANRQWFIDIAKTIQPSLFEKAVEICIDKSNVTPSYLKGIIKRWMDQKIYTLQDYNAKEMELANRKNMSKVKPLYKDFHGNNSKTKKPNPPEENVDDLDESMLEEIKLLEKKMGIS